MTLSAGTRLGPYEILGQIGAGGMGEVYRARDARLSREVAVKVLPAAVSSDPDRLKRFEKEARSASALNHPSIVTIHDIGESGGTSYIAMELVDGQTLREVLEGGAIPAKRLLAIAAPVADGLAKAHGAGIVHRDLKPENIMVTKDGFAKILDFGLAKLTEPEDSRGITQSPTVSGGTEPGIVMGTIGYMSPEQALGKPLDFRSDQFALGSILYEMATGKRAFSRGSTPETMSAIIRDEPEPIGALAPLTPAPLRWIVERCLAKNPDDRYASTRDLARDLSNLRDRLPEASGAVSAAGAPIRRATPIWTSVALVTLAAALAGVLVFGRARKPPVAAGPSRFLVDTGSSAAFFARPPVTGLAVSPDGRRIAFVAGSSSKFRLWVRSLDEVDPRPMPGTEWAASPFWSPDGRHIAFFAGGKLQRIAVAGGPPQVICETLSGSSGTWGPGGVILIGQWEGGGSERGLLRVSAEGGSPVVLTKAEPGHLHLWPDFLPDGRHFLFLDHTFQGDKHVVFVGALDSGEIRPLLSVESRVEYRPPGYLLFVRDTDLLARPFDPDRLRFTGEAIPVAKSITYFHRTGSATFSVSARSNVLAYQPRPFDSRLVWIDRDGRALGSVGAPAIFHQPPRLSPDGRRVAISVREPLTGIRGVWIYDVATGLPTRLTPGGVGDRLQPVWSPDGTRLAYGAARQTAPDLYALDLATGREQLLLAAPGTQTPFGWSPDGARIVYGDYSPTRRPPFRIGVLPLGTDAKSELPREGLPYSEYAASYSPDGRWLALVSEESGEPEVYLVPTGGGERRRVSSTGGEHPRWRGDGRELFYLDGDAKLIAVPVTPAATGIELGSPRILFSAGAAAIDFDVTTAGDRFLFQMGTEARPQPPIVVTLDWAAGLGK